MDDLLKYGQTSNFALDQYAPLQVNCPQALENLATAQFMTSTANIGEFGLANTFSNNHKYHEV